MSSSPIKAGSALLAPFKAVIRDFRGLRESPLALFGGIFGTVLSGAGLYALLLFSNEASANSEIDEMTIDFEPGALVKLGKKPEELEKIIVDETHVEEVATKETVTKEETPPPEEKEKKKDPPKKKPKDLPKKKKPDSKASDKNTKGNNKFDQLPTTDQLPGDPFGDPGGWSDLRKDGDPWATGVMKALNNMQIPSFAAKGKTGTYRFEIKICKNGRIEKVYKKGSSGDPTLDQAIQGELLKLKIPKPPAKHAANMKKPCVKLKYRFVWSHGGVK